MNLFHRLIPSVFFLGASAALVHALDQSSTFTLDLPFGASAATPAWLGHPVVGSSPFATLDLPIVPPDATASLLVTVFFQEENGGFMRISWQSAAAPPVENDGNLPGPGETSLSAVLCNNFYEGIGMNNQRSLLISADTLKQPGALHFQTGGSNLGISRIQMEWLEDSVGLSSPAINDVLVTSADGRTQSATDLSGDPATTQDPAWRGRLVNVPVTDVPLRIEQGLDFTVQIDGAPTMARIALKETGLPWGQHLVVWINNQRAGVLVPAMPSLDNSGYGATSSEPYIGWREGSFFVPSNALTAGADTLQFSAEPDAAPAASAASSEPALPLAVKDVVLQLAYPPASAVTETSSSTAPDSTVTTTPADANSSALIPSATSNTAPSADSSAAVVSPQPSASTSEAAATVQTSSTSSSNP